MNRTEDDIRRPDIRAPAVADLPASASRDTAVIITARNAAKTAAHAVQSALAQTLVTEVVFVDDGSADDTAAVAAAADDGSGRLQLIRMSANKGPSVGRNVAIAASKAPFICILDADDFLAPGRVASLFAAGGEGWDLLADDIVFNASPDAADAFDRLLDPGLSLPFDFTIDVFAGGNVSRKGRLRREFGFLKPLIRRSFVETHAIKYDERLRLGEDALYYLECLLAGGVFRVVPACGYHAVQSEGSLSGTAHDSAVLKAQLAALVDFSDKVRAHGLVAPGLESYRAATARKAAISDVLQAKRAHGWRGVARALGRCETNPVGILAELALMKLRLA